jgi:hypothetical protein
MEPCGIAINNVIVFYFLISMLISCFSGQFVSKTYLYTYLVLVQLHVRWYKLSKKRKEKKRKFYVRLSVHTSQVVENENTRGNTHMIAHTCVMECRKQGCGGVKRVQERQKGVRGVENRAWSVTRGLVCPKMRCQGVKNDLGCQKWGLRC